jgi:carbamoyl-phosphate synthase large subunit
MKSTGEVMGVDLSFGKAFYKSQLAANQALPAWGKILISVRNGDKRGMVFIAKKLADMDFELIATQGTYKSLVSNNIKVQLVGKISEGDSRILKLIRKGELKLVINTTSGYSSHSDMRLIRDSAVRHGIPCITTLQGAQAAVNGIEALVKGSLEIRAIQGYHA